MVLNENYVRITVKYNIPHEDMEKFIETIDPWFEKVDKEEEDNNIIRHKLIILSVLNSENETSMEKAYNLARRKSYPKTKRQFHNDVMKLLTEGYVYARKVDNKYNGTWYLTRDDAETIKLEVKK